MTKELSKKVVLITGCSSGFGLLTAVEMARSDFRVFASMRNLNKRGDLEEAAKNAKVSLDIIELDVTKQDSIHSALEEVEKKSGPVDILVNNAGNMLWGFADDVSQEDLCKQMDTNFFGTVNMTKAVIPKMRDRHTGHIINISSLFGLLSTPGVSSYCASKFALEGYMESLRYEGLLDGFYVSMIEPGYFNTLLFNNITEVLDPKSPNYRRVIKFNKYFKNASSKGAQPLDVANLVIKIAKSKNPGFRYPIGKEKIYLFLKNHLPEFIYEKLNLMAIKGIEQKE